jgi:hypothetical protein
LVTDRAAALKAVRRASGGSPVCCFGGGVPGREVFRLLIESIVMYCRGGLVL